MTRRHGVQRRQHVVLPHAQPADRQRHTVIPVSQQPCAVARQFEHRRAAQSPVGDEQRSLAAHLCARNAHGGVGHQSHQVVHTAIADSQREERRHGAFHLVAQRLQPAQTLSRRRTARSHGHEVVVPQRIQPFHLPSRHDADAQTPCRLRQAVDDHLRVLRRRKHTAVVLHRQLHAVAFKPPVGVAVVKDVEQPLHQPVATRIYRRQVAHILKRIRTIAAPAARHLHFGQHPMATLEDGDTHLRPHLFQIGS